jgi:NADH:ubiquinone oxidoreductase subunit F (NADH-binding)
MNYESLADGGFATGTMMGSGGFIVLDEDQCIVEHTMTLARFYTMKVVDNVHLAVKEQDGCTRF